jgi:hypothetical protein
VTIPQDGRELAKIKRLLGWPERGVLRRDAAIGVRPDSFYYSLHRLYDSKTGLLRHEALVLHRKGGGIVAHVFEREVDRRGQCDGCAIPSYFPADTGVYRPLQAFELPGFAYPVLLLDSSTYEGEALSLLTFTPGGKVTRFVVYERVMHCV